jgi:hypothetical protein
MAFLRRAGFYLIFVSATSFLGCQKSTVNQAPSHESQQANFSGVLMWKGDPSGTGLYSNELTLIPANVNVTQFGKVGTFQADGLVMAQPLYISGVKMPQGTHDLIIVATEHDSVYAIDADSPGSAPLWERHYVDSSSGVTTMPDNFGGRTAIGGEVGITGTPYLDAATGALYFVTTLSRNGVAEQWLRAIDVTTGQDYGPGGVQIQASVPGDGQASVNGQIAFDPSIENQRPGLTMTAGSLSVAWGAFSDWGVYHGWLMAFDPATLQMKAVFNATTQYQANDWADGPADHGGGGAFWQGGAAPTVDADGNIYINASDGSFNADQGGQNYGDTLLKLELNGNTFQVLDSFTPANADCIDLHDLELGSGGVTLLPTDFTNGVPLAAAYSKEGRLFVVNRSKLGGYNDAGDTQIPQEFMVGEQSCSDSISGDVAEGPDWNRLYGNPAYWNGNLYAAASNLPLKQYQFQGGLLSPTPFAMSPEAYGLRGGNIVVSANGTQNAIVWGYEKAASSQGILHAYDATDVSKELWNSNMNAGRDGMGTGIGFGTPVVINGRVIAATENTVNIFGPIM